MRFLDRESILVCAVIGLMTGIGTVVGICGLLGVDLAKFGAWTVGGLVLGIAGLVCGILLLRNIRH